MYVDGNILKNNLIFNQFFTSKEILTFISSVLFKKKESSDNDNIIHCPGFLDGYKGILPFFTIFNDDSIKDELLKIFTNNNVKKIKATIDTLFLNFLQSIKLSIDYCSVYEDKIKIVLGRKSAHRDKYQTVSGTIQDLYDDAVVYLKDQIESRGKEKFDSGLVFDAINCFGKKDPNCQVINAWFKDVYSLLDYYKKYLFFATLIHEKKTSEKRVFIGITADKQVFFTVNKILNSTRCYSLQKVVFPWQITADKNYFKKVNLNTLPEIRGVCAEWQYKYLFNKPLSLWEKTKLHLLTKRYLLPTAAVAVTGLALGARWWLNRNNPPRAKPGWSAEPKISPATGTKSH